MRVVGLLARGSLGVGLFATGWGAGCAATTTNPDHTENGPLDGGGTHSDGSGDDASSTAECPLCVTDMDCNGGICAQLGSDSYCAPACSTAGTCASDRTCTTVSSITGTQVDVCVPRGGVCSSVVGPGTPDGGSGPGNDSGAPPPNNTCGTLAGPNVTATCASCGTHTCQPNGCYGGWWCNTATKKCQAPPTNCTNAPDAGGGSDGGVINIDAGGPVNGTVGPNGGSVTRLYFAVVGDTRPPAINDTAGYPTAVITKIYQDINGLSPKPPFAVTTGDYMFSTANGTQAAPQVDMYLQARSQYSGITFPTMGNHECTGAVTSNCGQGNADGLTVNFQTFMSKMIQPLGKQTPYYRIDINAQDNSWTAKFLFVAANAWDSGQATWLQQQMGQATTYTFVVRHEPSAASSPGTSASEQIMAQHPYTLALVGHTHTYGKTGAKQVTIGNGGAPLTGGVNYGFALIGQRADGALTVDMIDYSTLQADSSFHFAVKPDGTPAP